MPNEQQTKAQYADFKKPPWSPPSWVFAPVWTILYLIIALTFGYVAYLYTQGNLGLFELMPFVLNLIFNIAYTPIQFKLRSFDLALLDIELVWTTLVWALIVIWPIAPWIAYANIPYLAWVSFATVLQFSITALNTKKP